MSHTRTLVSRAPEHRVALSELMSRPATLVVWPVSVAKGVSVPSFHCRMLRSREQLNIILMVSPHTICTGHPVEDETSASTTRVLACVLACLVDCLVVCSPPSHSFPCPPVVDHDALKEQNVRVTATTMTTAAKSAGVGPCRARQTRRSQGAKRRSCGRKTQAQNHRSSQFTPIVPSADNHTWKQDDGVAQQHVLGHTRHRIGVHALEYDMLCLRLVLTSSTAITRAIRLVTTRSGVRAQSSHLSPYTHASLPDNGSHAGTYHRRERVWANNRTSIFVFWVYSPAVHWHVGTRICFTSVPFQKRARCTGYCGVEKLALPPSVVHDGRACIRRRQVACFHCVCCMS